MTEIEKNHPRVFAFSYILKDPQGKILDSSETNQPLPFLEGRQQIIPMLEQQLIQMAEGDKKSIFIKAADAYGEFRSDMVIDVPKDELAHLKIEIGSHLQLELGQGAQVVKVAKISETHVTLDGNHPLSGVDLVFDVELVLIRQATVDEVIHGHTHGLHGQSQHH